MSATPATTAEGGRRWGSEFFAVLQRIGRSLMLPIAVLPAAALLLRLGQDDLLGPDGLGWIGRPRSSATPAEPCSTTCPCSSPSGSRPIITAFAVLGLGVVFGIVWPPIGEALGNFAEWLYGLGPVGPGSTAPPTAPSSPSACITSIATGPLLIIPVGLAYAVLYYFLFRVLIRRFDLATPGRERTEGEAEEAGLITRST